MSTNKTISSAKSVFGQRLKEARLRQKLSQKKLGILANIDEFSASPRINQYERGTHTPDFQMACCLAKVLKIPACYLYINDQDWLEIVSLLYELDKNELKEVKNYLSQKVSKVVSQ